MCGIAGYFNTEPMDPSCISSKLNSMIDSIEHRGPDGRGVKIFSTGGLGHARLAIIDLENGAQPLSAKRYNITLTFNGEIYNYRQLRKSLIEKGCCFATDSDSEVILHLYGLEGIAGFRYLRGMFAFAIHDKEKGKVVLVRDPLGIKPLFFKLNHQAIIFSSEVKGILAADSTSKLNKQGLHYLLNFRYIPDQMTLFDGISQLAPGEVLEWEIQRGSSSSRLLSMQEDDVPVESTLACIQESVEAHLVSDVPVGAYLSGGIDSSLIVSMASKHLPTPMDTFTLDVGDDKRELSNAVEGSKLLGVRHHAFSAPLHYADLVDKVLWHCELPKVNALQSWLMAKGVSSELKVVLSGLGGDELFLGYNLHKLMAVYEKSTLSLPEKANMLMGRLITSINQLCFGSIPFGYAERIGKILIQSHTPHKVYGLLRNVWDTGVLRQMIYGPAMCDESLESAYSLIGFHWDNNKTPLENARLFEFNQKMVNDLLWNEDRMSMAHGVEVRVPFVDKKLVAHVSRFSTDALMPKGEKKGYMRQAITGALPMPILTRPKSGFQLDAAHLFEIFLRDAIIKQLDSGVFQRYELFNEEFVKTILSAPVSKRHIWHYFMLFLMYQTHRWISLFDVKVH